MIATSLCSCFFTLIYIGLYKISFLFAASEEFLELTKSALQAALEGSLLLDKNDSLILFILEG